MKKQRSLPFGYTMKNGSIITENAEARLVKRIYRMYENGGSLSSIAKELQKQSVPYSPASPSWNKHMIKRILENERYTGAYDIPAIISEETYQRIRSIYQEKTISWQSPSENPKEAVWKVLACADCGGKLKRVGGRGAEVAILECSQCKSKIRLNKQKLFNTLLNELQNLASVEQATYQPNKELIQLENAINREIEKPVDCGETREMILKAAALRYSLCPCTQTEADKKLSEKDLWMRFKNEVTAVLISAEEINIRYERSKNAGVSEKCACDTGKPNADGNGQA